MSGVAAVVLRGADVLLIRRGREPMLGAWSLPGGALELGETTAEGVAREVFEETRRDACGRLRSSLRWIVLFAMKTDDVRFHYVLVEWHVPLRRVRLSWFVAMMRLRRGG